MSKKSKYIEYFSQYEKILESLKEKGVIDEIIERNEKALLD
ncbi:hypothetical protein [Spartinivicinus ruber]|nr:hypothetical protein [Spartinivicinus ruber]